MNWRRGLLLAAINLAVAVPLVRSTETRDDVMLRQEIADRSDAAAAPTPTPVPAAEPQGEAVSFPGPCSGSGGWIIDYPHQEDILRQVNLPATFLTYWRLECPAKWSLSGLMGVSDEGPITFAYVVGQRKSDIGFLLFLIVQWFLVGGFPLRRPKMWWREPGMFITLCAVISLALYIVPPDNLISRFFSLFAACAWLWWFGLLVWKLGRSAWKWTARRLADNPI